MVSGSNTILVNDEVTQLKNSAVVKQGSLFVPIAEVAQILGLEKNVDAKTGVITFKN